MIGSARVAQTGKGGRSHRVGGWVTSQVERIRAWKDHNGKADLHWKHNSSRYQCAPTILGLDFLTATCSTVDMENMTLRNRKQILSLRDRDDIDSSWQ